MCSLSKEVPTNLSLPHCRSLQQDERCLLDRLPAANWCPAERSLMTATKMTTMTTPNRLDATACLPCRFVDACRFKAVQGNNLGGEVIPLDDWEDGGRQAKQRPPQLMTRGYDQTVIPMARGGGLGSFLVRCVQVPSLVGIQQEGQRLLLVILDLPPSN